MWNIYTSKNPKPQHQGTSQGFRVIGGCTKSGNKVRAYKVRASHGMLEYMHSFLSSGD